MIDDDNSYDPYHFLSFIHTSHPFIHYHMYDNCITMMIKVNQF